MTGKPFTSLPLSPALQQVIKEIGYQELTPIQGLTIPPLLNGLDVIGQSKTGSGKTAAFAIPILEKIRLDTRHVQALILCPTRELCQQVAREIRRLGRAQKNLQVLTLSGGHPVYLDLKALRNSAPIVVGTPGRINDHLKRKTLDLSSVQFVVLDEADRMLDMGFRESIELILKSTPHERQTALFSATFPTTIESLSRHYQKSPQRLTVEDSLVEQNAIDQLFYFAEARDKTAALLAFLRSRKLESTLVFCNLKDTVDELIQCLRPHGVSTDKLHGGLEQLDRERVMAKFRNLSTRVLIATDVAARGLDIKGLDAVVNFDLPRDPETYIHRIGRTGRAGATGLAVSFVMRQEMPKLERLWAYTGEQFEVKAATSLTSNPMKTPALAAMDTLSISAGRKDKLRAGDILGALTGDAGIKGDQVGKIEILDHMSFVAIAKSSSSLALSRLRAGKIKGRRFIIQAVR